MTLVAGVDSSTQACKVVIRDSETGKVVRTGRAAHPDGTEIDPERWWQALQEALSDAGGIDDVAALSIAAQQHGLICLDERGDVVRPALLWNDTRSAPEADTLVAELSAAEWAQAVGSVPLASFTVSKLRWIAEHDVESARHTEAVCLPHDWLTWRLRHAMSGSRRRLDTLTTDRSDASGTGYYSPMANAYRLDLIERAFGRRLILPKVLAPADPAGYAGRAILGAGLGDNAAAALALCASTGDVVTSLGTSGTVFTRADVLTPDDSGRVAGFADGTGHYLPLVCTLNGTRVLDAVESILSVDHAGLSALALSAPQGAGGLVLLPYFAGERTPNLPTATGTLLGLRDKTSTPSNLARAAVEGVLCGLADALDALVERGVHCNRLLLIGGGARLPAVRTIAPSVFRRSVFVPQPSEYVADGAALQALWALDPAHQPAPWVGGVSSRFFPESDGVTVHAQYGTARRQFRDGTLDNG